MHVLLKMSFLITNITMGHIYCYFDWQCKPFALIGYWMINVLTFYRMHRLCKTLEAFREQRHLNASDRESKRTKLDRHALSLNFKIVSAIMFYLSLCNTVVAYKQSGILSWCMANQSSTTLAVL